jgi:hypothetical protein
VKNGGAIRPFLLTSSWRGTLLIKHTNDFTFLRRIVGPTYGQCVICSI